MYFPADFDHDFDSRRGWSDLSIYHTHEMCLRLLLSRGGTLQSHYRPKGSEMGTLVASSLQGLVHDPALFFRGYPEGCVGNRRRMGLYLASPDRDYDSWLRQVGAPVRQRQQLATAWVLARRQQQTLGVLSMDLVRHIGKMIPGLEEPTREEMRRLMRR